MVDITLKRGTRGFITGKSGSGKTQLALRLCEVMPPPLVILDTKYDPTIAAWAKANRIKVWNKKDMPDWKRISSDIVVRPRSSWLAHPNDLDWWLGQAFTCRYVPSIFIDEGYQVGATVSKVGQGVAGLWTRGRAFGMRTLLGAQRPAWISKFVISESDALYVGRLILEEDRQAIRRATGFEEAMEKQEAFHFLYIRQDGNEPTAIKPIDIAAPSQYDARQRGNLVRMRGTRQ